MKLHRCSVQIGNVSKIGYPEPAATQVGSRHFAVYAKAWKFFGILKTERIYRHKPESFEEANKMIDERIYFYNHERIQTKTGLAPLTLRQSC